MKYARILAEFYNTPWLMLRSRFDAFLAVVEDRSAGGTISAEELMEFKAFAVEAQSRSGASSYGAIGVLPVQGIIAHHAGMVNNISGPGGVSVDSLTAQFRAMVADPNVKAIILNIDSPGGGVPGVPELAAEILAARDQKPIVAVSNSMAASAAYWIASQCTEIVCIPSGEVGSIGVVAKHRDESGAMAAAGVKDTFITDGDYKVEGNSTEPLSDDARSAIQARVTEFGNMFRAAVSKGRGVPVKTVASDYGKGRMLGAQSALKAGMIDRIDTLDNTIRRLSSPRGLSSVSNKGVDAAGQAELEFELPSLPMATAYNAPVITIVDCGIMSEKNADFVAKLIDSQRPQSINPDPSAQRRRLLDLEEAEAA